MVKEYFPDRLNRVIVYQKGNFFVDERRYLASERQAGTSRFASLVEIVVDASAMHSRGGKLPVHGQLFRAARNDCFHGEQSPTGPSSAGTAIVVRI